MNRRNIFISVLCVIIIAGFGCTGDKEKQWTNVPWSVVSPELSLRLVVPQKTVPSGARPTCIMEIMNTSGNTILVDKSFSLNGPQVRTSHGTLMPQRGAAEIDTGDSGSFHRVEPGETLSIKAKPNYEMTQPGKYTLSFPIHPTWWGLEDPRNPGKTTPHEGTGPGILVSNEVEISVY